MVEIFLYTHETSFTLNMDFPSSALDYISSHAYNRLFFVQPNPELDRQPATPLNCAHEYDGK